MHEAYLASLEEARQRKIERDNENRKRCTCCPVHPRYDIPLGGRM
jgi:hypothetical protein